MRFVPSLASAIAVERTLSLTDWPITALMLAALVWGGPFACFVVGCVLELAIAIAVLELHLFSVRRWNFDVIGLTQLRQMLNSSSPVDEIQGKWYWLRWMRRAKSTLALKTKLLARSLLGSYWLMILVGSMIPILEPDYVTLFLRRDHESRLSVILRVTVPAVVWSIGLWTLIFWLGQQGVGWAIALGA